MVNDVHVDFVTRAVKVNSDGKEYLSHIGDALQLAVDSANRAESSKNTAVESAEKAEIWASVAKQGNPLYIHFPYRNSHGNNAGDCAIIVNDNKNIIVDFGGGWFEELNDYIKNILGITKFDYAFISHWHGDHIGNLTQFLNNFDFSDCMFIVPPTIDYSNPNIVNPLGDGSGTDGYPAWSGMTVSRHDVENMQDTEAACKIYITAKSKKGYYTPTNNEIIKLTDHLDVRCLNCDTDVFESYYGITIGSQNTDEHKTVINNFSMINEFIHGANRLLFTGDIESAAQEKNAKYIYKSPIFYKVEHHGVNVSASDKWLSRINPRYAFVDGGAYNLASFSSRQTSKHLELCNTQISTENECENTTYYSNSNSVSVIAENYSKFERYMTYASGTSIADGSDLNNYKASGVYEIVSKASYETLSNVPPMAPSTSGKLEVSQITPVIIMQKFINRFGAEYIRTYYIVNNVWYEWQCTALGDSEAGRYQVQANENLNSEKYVNLGSYICYNSLAPSILNSPTKEGFVLNVIHGCSSNDRQQTVIDKNGKIFVRYCRYELNTWNYNEWEHIVTNKQYPVRITEGANLDAFIKAGIYQCDASSITNTLYNRPFSDGGFVLEVIETNVDNSPRCVQKIYKNNDAEARIWYRHGKSSGWNKWRYIIGTEVNTINPK